MTKKFSVGITTLGAAAALLIFAGCSSDTSEDVSTPGSTSSETQATSSPSPSSSVGEVEHVDFGKDLEATFGWVLEDDFPHYEQVSSTEEYYIQAYEGGWVNELLYEHVETLEEYQLEFIEDIPVIYEDQTVILAAGNEICEIMETGTQGEYADFMSAAFNEFLDTGNVDKSLAAQYTPQVLCPDMTDETSDAINAIGELADTALSQTN